MIAAVIVVAYLVLSNQEKARSRTVESPEWNRLTLDYSFEEGTIPAAKGTLAESSAERRLYTLDNDWAGGTLELRVEQGQIVVELTVFGSGLPVVYAHRGTLVVVPL